MAEQRETPKISVIVPIYKAEAFLKTCVNSVLKQTYANIEVILVDDGSPDACPRLCDEYAARDARVRVLHTENGGLSLARNRGVAVASGAFVTFVDADDYVDAGFIACLYEAMHESGAQMSVCGTRFVDGQGNTLPPVIAPARRVLDAPEALREMLYQRLFFNSAWGKLLPLALAQAHPFPPRQWYEDLATTYRWIDAAGRVAVDTAPHYAYVQHAKSFMAQTFTPERFTLLTVSDTVYGFIETRYPAILPAARARRFAAYCQVLLQTPPGGQYRSERKRMRERMRGDARLVAQDGDCRKKDRVAAAAFCLLGEPGLRALWRVTRKGAV